MERILIVGAHYDDAELGAGGTGAKLAALGKEVYKITLTDNRTVSANLGLDIDTDSSIKESASACAILGIQELEFEPEPCTFLQYSTKLMQRLEDIIFAKKIDTVFMHFEDDYNQDHVEANRLCKTAARHCKNLLTYQSNGYVLPTPYYPTVFSDITAFADAKLKALKCYENQHNRFDKLFETTLDRNKSWGYAHKVGYAEAFHPIKIDIGL